MLEIKKDSNNPWFMPAVIFFVKTSIYTGVLVVGALFLGKILDTYFNTSPYITLVAITISFVGSIFGILHEIKNYKKNI